eukprot:gene2876-2105_t
MHVPGRIPPAVGPQRSIAQANNPMMVPQKQPMNPPQGAGLNIVFVRCGSEKNSPQPFHCNQSMIKIQKQIAAIISMEVVAPSNKLLLIAIISRTLVANYGIFTSLQRPVHQVLSQLPKVHCIEDLQD